MKKQFLLLALLTRSIFSMAQCIVDQTVQNPGAYPETLPNGSVNGAYSASVTIASYPEIILAGSTFYKDSIEVFEVNNLPSGITFSCETQNCTRTIADNDLVRYCINFNGIPTSENINDTITINFYEYISIFSVPTIFIESVKLKLKILNNLGISEEKMNAISIYPNPTSNDFIIQNNSNKEIESLAIFSSNGNIVSTYLNDNIKAHLAIPLNVPSGVYFVEVQLSSSEMIRKRLIKL